MRVILNVKSLRVLEEQLTEVIGYLLLGDLLQVFNALLPFVKLIL